jgi:hypothetical protein
MTRIKDIKFEGVGPHSITLGAQYAIEKEEVFLYFSATWLNKPVRFHQRADRYSYSSTGLCEWRHYVVEGNFVDESAHNSRGASLSDTARDAVGEATREIVDNWLVNKPVIETALQLIPVYRDSANRALARAIQRLGSSYDPWTQINGAVKVHRMRLVPDVEESLKAYATALFNAERANADVTRSLEEGSWFNSYSWRVIERSEVSA